MKDESPSSFSYSFTFSISFTCMFAATAFPIRTQQHHNCRSHFPQLFALNFLPSLHVSPMFHMFSGCSVAPSHNAIHSYYIKRQRCNSFEGYIRLHNPKDPVDEEKTETDGLRVGRNMREMWGYFRVNLDVCCLLKLRGIKNFFGVGSAIVNRISDQVW